MLSTDPKSVPTQTLKPSIDHLREIRYQLVRLAEARQASISAETCQVYSDALLRYDILDVTSAINAIAVEPKADFETSFPCLGTIVDRTKRARQRRIRSMSKPCSVCADGWIVVDRLSPNRRLIKCQCRLEHEAIRGQLGA